ncbi:MAG: hypothetical protein K2N94_13265 [Lachnospiraceae bacterium]|nr:hypothetical protein [Lachnospiraceae bacterium]
MEPDIYSLAKAGLSREEIDKITQCGDKERKMHLLRKYRCRLLDEIHRKQQSLDEIDYMISRMKEHS